MSSLIFLSMDVHERQLFMRFQMKPVPLAVKFVIASMRASAA